MSKHWLSSLAALVLLTGCEGSGQIAVRVATARADGEIVGREKLTVRALPYNRDSIFDELEAAAERPEPEIPEDLTQLRDSIAEAQNRWREAEAQWMQVRSELQSLSNRLQQLDRSSQEYFRLFEQFDELEAREARLRQRQQRLFEQYTEIQNAYSARADSINAVIGAWERETFEDFGTIVDSLLEARGREEHWDTTDSGGWASFILPSGKWWVHTRYELPFDELYWNVPIEVSGGEEDTLTLNESNAELRPIF